MYSFDAARLLARLQRSRFAVRTAPPVLLQLRPGGGTRRFVERHRPTPVLQDMLFRAATWVMPSSTEAAALVGARNMLVVDAEAVAAMLDAGEAWRHGHAAVASGFSAPPLTAPAVPRRPPTPPSAAGGGRGVAESGVDASSPRPTRRGGRCLDMGAGVGTTTAELQRVFDDVTATEVSPGCLARLQRLQPPLHSVMHAQTLARQRRQRTGCGDDGGGDGGGCGDGDGGDAPFDVVCMLNLLDRCGPRPISLLRAARAMLRPSGEGRQRRRRPQRYGTCAAAATNEGSSDGDGASDGLSRSGDAEAGFRAGSADGGDYAGGGGGSGGRLLVALAFPFNPFEVGGGRKGDEAEVLEMRQQLGPATDFEDFAARAVAFFNRQGLRCEVLARAPYMCQADARWARESRRQWDLAAAPGGGNGGGDDGGTDRGDADDDAVAGAAEPTLALEAPASLRTLEEEERVRLAVYTEYFLLDDALFLLSPHPGHADDDRGGAAAAATRHA